MLERTLVFVDTSYLLASFYNSWETGARAQLEIDLPEVVAVLGNMITDQLHQPIHRQFWYDGIPDSGPHRYQRALRTCDGVQLRAGQLIEWGDRRTQKGVDTRLVADMVVTAMRQEVTDIVLVSGDADMIPGVQEATHNGIRVHLYGFGWDSMSSALRHNCDTTTILDPREDFADAMQLEVLEGPLPPVVHSKPLGDAEPIFDPDATGMTPVPDSSMPPAVPTPTEPAPAEPADAGVASVTDAGTPEPGPSMEDPEPREPLLTSPTAADSCAGPDAATKEDTRDDVEQLEEEECQAKRQQAKRQQAKAQHASHKATPADLAKASQPINPAVGPTATPAPAPAPAPVAPQDEEQQKSASQAHSQPQTQAPAQAAELKATAKPTPKPSMMAPRRKLRSRYVPLPEEIWASAGFQTPFDVGQQYASWWYDNAATSEQRDHAHMLSGGGLPPEIDRPLLQFACETLHEYTLSESQRVNLRDGFHSGIRGVLINIRRDE